MRLNQPAALGNVYIVTSGEIPSWLPAHQLRPVGPGAVNATVAGFASDAAADDDGARTSCHARHGFTRTVLSMPLDGLIAASGGGAAHLRHRPPPPLGSTRRRLFVVPHSALFPAPARELPTFNSNGVLSVVHRIPRLGKWFLYSDDDTIITSANLTLAAWWDERRAAQRLYFSRGHGIHRKRAHSSNNWEEAMSHMSGLLDGVRTQPPATSAAPSAAGHRKFLDVESASERSLCSACSRSPPEKRARRLW